MCFLNVVPVPCFSQSNDSMVHLIENSMEAIRAVQRDKQEFGIGAAYRGRIEINIDFESKEIEIRDNGRGMTDSDVRNAVNYGRLKNRITSTGEVREKVNDEDVALLPGSYH